MKRRLGKTAAVILTRGGLFCLSQRTNTEMFSGYWQYPGGREDSPEETHLQIALRELKEETGLTPHPARLNELGNNIYDTDCESCVLFHLELHPGEEPQWIEKHKHNAWRWFPFGMIKGLQLIEGTYTFVEKVYLDKNKNTCKTCRS